LTTLRMNLRRQKQICCRGSPGPTQLRAPKASRIKRSFTRSWGGLNLPRKMPSCDQRFWSRSPEMVAVHRRPSLLCLALPGRHRLWLEVRRPHRTKPSSYPQQPAPRASTYVFAPFGLRLCLGLRTLGGGPQIRHHVGTLHREQQLLQRTVRDRPQQGQSLRYQRTRPPSLLQP
jgi:hypothetical protein